MGRGKKPTTNTYEIFVASVESQKHHRTVVPIPGSCPFHIAAHQIKAFPPVDDQGKKFRIPGFCSAVRPDRLVFRVPGDNASHLVDLRQLRATVRTLLSVPQADHPSVLEAVMVAYRCLCRHFGGVGTANEAEFEQEFMAQAFFGLYLEAACAGEDDAKAAADKWREKRGKVITENEDKALEKARARHIPTGSNPSIGAPQGTIVTDPRDEAAHAEGGDAGRRAALIRQPAASGLPSAEVTPLPVPEDPVLKTSDWALDAEKDTYLMDFAEAPPPPLRLAGSGPKSLLPPPPPLGKAFRGKDLEAQGIFVERKRRPPRGNN